MDKQKPYIIIIIKFLDNLDKKNLLISILVPIFSTNVDDVVMINIDIYHMIYKFKKISSFYNFYKRFRILN